jgi:hypothetical protein
MQEPVVVSHLAGPVVDFQTDQGAVVRQRCQWCGATLVDACTWLAAVHPPPAEGEALVATWEVGRFVDTATPDNTGGWSSLNGWTAGPVPDTACMRMPLEVTG